MIKIGIVGYGNLGRGVECAVSKSNDMELVGVFSRRNPETVKTHTNVPVYEMKKVYDLVLNNQKFALDQYKDGANARQITKMVESNFKLNGGYDLIHSLGHGVGLEIHELPYMSYRFDTMLRENMVVTDEPGIYIPGKFGVRIEDTVQITKFGCISLTNSEKNYIII